MPRSYERFRVVAAQLLLCLFIKISHKIRLLGGSCWAVTRDATRLTTLRDSAMPLGPSHPDTKAR